VITFSCEIIWKPWDRLYVCTGVAVILSEFRSENKFMQMNHTVSSWHNWKMNSRKGKKSNKVFDIYVILVYVPIAYKYLDFFWLVLLNWVFSNDELNVIRFDAVINSFLLSNWDFGQCWLSIGLTDLNLFGRKKVSLGGAGIRSSYLPMWIWVQIANHHTWVVTCTQNLLSNSNPLQL